MAEPGYDRQDNMFDRIGSAIFGRQAPDRPTWVDPRAPLPERREEDRGAIRTGVPQAAGDPNRYGGTRGAPNMGGSAAATEPDVAPGTRGGAAAATEPDVAPQTRGGAAAATEPDVAPQVIYEPGDTGPKVTPGGNKPSKQIVGGGGGGGGRSAGGRKLLGDQTRREAYDPTLDVNDPRNIGVIDTSGNVNKQVYAASPMAHPEAYPAGTDQFTPGGQTSQTIDQTGGQAKPATTNALKGALDYIGNLFHQTTPDQHTNEGYVALTKGAVGAPDDDTMRAVFASVDPKNELPMKERMELATKAAYDWYNHNGQPDKANKVAAEVLQYGNKMAQSYGDQAMKDMKSGNREQAIKNIQTAYGFLPDGYHADVDNKNNMVIHDGKGNVTQTIPLDDKMVQNLATGLATGTLFYDVAQHHAGVTTPFKPPQPPPQAVSTAAPGTTPATSAPVPGGGPVPPGGSPAPAATPSPAPAAPPPAPAPQVTRPGSPPPAPSVAAPPAGAISTQPPQMSPYAPTGGQPAPGAAPPPPPSPPPPPPPTQQAPTTPPPPPAASPQTAAATPPPDQKPAAPTQPAAPKEPVVVRADKGDPDSLPVTINGKTQEPYREHSETVTPEIQRAQAAVETADKQLQVQLQEIRDLRSHTDKKDYGRIQKLNTAEKQANAQRNDAVAAHNEVLRDARQSRRENDAEEKKHLERHELKGQDLANGNTAVDGVFQNLVDKKDPLLANSPLRLYNDSTKWAPLREAALELSYHNPGLTPTKAAQYIITMTSHLGDDDAGKAQNFNKGPLGGEKGSQAARYMVVNKDLLHQPVVVLGDGKTHLHVPQPLLEDIQRFKNDSYQEAWDKDPKNPKNVKKAADAAAVPPTNYGALMPGQLQKTIEGIKAEGEREKANLAPGEKMELKPNEKPPPGMTNAQAREWVLRQQRKAQAEADKRRLGE